MTRATAVNDRRRSSSPTDPNARRMACGTCVTAKGCAVETEIRSRIKAIAMASAMRWRCAASRRFSASSRATVPSSIQPQTMAAMVAGQRPRSKNKALLAGSASGITTMVAHSGGPPLAMYLLPLGLSKEMYGGTTSMFFTIGNLLKAGPWLAVGELTAGFWGLVVICLPAAFFGVWAGWRLHHRLNQAQMVRACYGLLVVTAVKLLWDGVAGAIQ